MYELGVVYRNIPRADIEVAAALGASGTATVHEAMGRVGLMHPYMRPIYPSAQASGSAVTVLLHPGDNWMLHVAAEQIQPGDVVVAAVTAESTDGFFGELLATSFKARGARALVIDGGCRDVKALGEMDFPVWCRAPFFLCACGNNGKLFPCHTCRCNCRSAPICPSSIAALP